MREILDSPQSRIQSVSRKEAQKTSKNYHNHDFCGKSCCRAKQGLISKELRFLIQPVRSVNDVRVILTSENRPHSVTADSSGPDRSAAVFGEFFNRSDTALDGPVVDIGNAEIFRVVEMGCCSLPFVLAVGLPFSRHLHIQLLD